jgi:hypothetical protein
LKKFLVVVVREDGGRMKAEVGLESQLELRNSLYSDGFSVQAHFSNSAMVLVFSACTNGQLLK